MPVSFQLEMRPLRQSRLRGFGGQALHGLIFGILLAGDPRYAQSVHTAARKPFAISPLAGGQVQGRYTLIDPEHPVSCMLSFMEDKAVAVFTKGASKGGHSLGASEVEILSCNLIDCSDYQSLTNEDDSPSRAFMEFFSPTTLRKGGQNMPFPEPGAVISSLLVRWNAFAPERARFPADTCERSLFLQRFNLRSSSVPIHTYNALGFTGSAVFGLPREAERRRSVLTLLRFARFCGVGHHTAMGMGHVQVRLEAAGSASPGVRSDSQEDMQS